MLKRKVEEATGDLIKQTDALDRMRSDFSGKQSTDRTRQREIHSSDP